MKIRSLFNILTGAALALTTAACGGAGKAEMLQETAAKADSVVNANWGGNVTVNAAGTGLDVTFHVTDTILDMDAVGQELFDVFASQQLKTVAPEYINLVKNTLNETKGDLTIQFVTPQEKTKAYTLTPRRFVDLQRAKLTDLNASAAKSQVLAAAKSFCPNPKAHADAKLVDVTNDHTFIQYNIEWPDAKKFSQFDQGFITFNYLNALKKEYQELGSLGYPIVEMLESLGYAGVSVEYTAEGSDKSLRQGFAWRNIQEPIEEPNADVKK